VLPAPATAPEHVIGPQWDQAAGQASDPDKLLRVSLAMIREDVWQAVANYPISNLVTLDCDACGQKDYHHGPNLRCPPLLARSPDARYAHGPVFPAGVEHAIERGDRDETVWYGLDAVGCGVRAAWDAIVAHFRDRDRKLDEGPVVPAAQSVILGAALDELRESLGVHPIDPRPPSGTLPSGVPRPAIGDAHPDGQTCSSTQERAIAREWFARREAERQRRKDRPRFGDFKIDYADGVDWQSPGAWIFRSSAPGVIGIGDHMSMYLADRQDAPGVVLDALAQLHAVSQAMSLVGIPWRPAASCGPQSTEWGQHARFARTILDISWQEATRSDAPPCPATLGEVIDRLGCGHGRASPGSGAAG
jgi:hypothetical protein